MYKMKKIKFPKLKRPKVPILSDKKIHYTCVFAFLVLSALLLTCFLEYRFFRNDFWPMIGFIGGYPIAFFFNVFLMFLMLLFLWGLFEKPGTAVGAMWIILTLITFAHINKYNSRGVTLLPEDFQLADQVGSLKDFVSVKSIIKLLIAIALIIVLTILFNHKASKKMRLEYERKSPSFLKRHFVATRVVIMAISVLAFCLATAPIRSRNGRTEGNFLGTQFTAWNQNRNFEENGFIVGFLYNLQKFNIDPPEEYEENEIAGIREKYDKIAEEGNKSRISAADEDVNIVVILNESFIDPESVFQDVTSADYYQYTGGDITPNLHRIMSKYPSGLMYSTGYGGGTANIEFEVFTGLSNYWVGTVPYTALIPKSGDIPSIAQTYKAAGYKTTAIHPYNGGMYKRNISLPNEGFDTFIDQLSIAHTEHDGNSDYINDKSAYNQVLDLLNDNDEKQVIGLITMQNHTPYNADNYDEYEFKVLNENIDEKDAKDVEVYYQTLHNSDKYLGEFIDELDKLDKKVAVLFFGDHSAGEFDLMVDGGKESFDLSRITPYFVYTNYETEYTEMNLPTTSPNCLTNTMYNTLNWQKDPLYYILDEVCVEEPILAPDRLQDYRPERAGVIRDYELVIYDILSGKKYWMAD